MKGMLKAERLVDAAMKAAQEVTIASQFKTFKDVMRAKEKARAARTELIRYIRALRARERYLTLELRASLGVPS